MIARRVLEWIKIFEGPAGLKFFRYLLDKFFKKEYTYNSACVCFVSFCMLRDY